MLTAVSTIYAPSSSPNFVVEDEPTTKLDKVESGLGPGGFPHVKQDRFSVRSTWVLPPLSSRIEATRLRSTSSDTGTMSRLLFTKEFGNQKAPKTGGGRGIFDYPRPPSLFIRLKAESVIPIIAMNCAAPPQRLLHIVCQVGGNWTR